MGYLRFLVLAHSVRDDKRRLEIEEKLAQLAEQEQQIKDAADLGDKMEAEGASMDEILKITPSVDADFRGPEIGKFFNIDPGYALAALKLLVR